MGTLAKIYKFCVKQKRLSENDSENEINRMIGSKVMIWTNEVPTLQPTGGTLYSNDDISRPTLWGKVLFLCSFPDLMGIFY